MAYDPSWDLPHEIERDLTWQESDCYWFFDAKAGIGGWHRIGQYPNKAIGQSTIFLYEIGGRRFLDRSIEVPADQCRRTKTGQVVGRSSVDCLAPQIMSYRYENEQVRLDMTFEESFYEPRDWVQAGEFHRAWEKGHLEVAGRLRGEVRIAGNRYKLDALAHRDHSWGPRSMQGIDVLWFCNGTTGPKLSWAGFTARFATGEIATFGFVARDRQTQEITGIDVNVITASDGITPLHGFLTLKTESGFIDLDIRTNQGFMQRFIPEPFMVLDQSSTIQVEGLTGFADFASVQNTMRGNYLPTGKDLVLTCVEDGLSNFQNHENALAGGARRLLQGGA